MQKSGCSFEKTSARFKKHLTQLKSYLKKQATNFESEVKSQAKECIKPQGKYLRPLLVFSAANSTEIDNSILNRAACAELIHLASLIHDDVIDDAALRRGNPTIYKQFGTKNAILLGDVIFAHAMGMAFDEGDPLVWKASVDAVKSLCQGEIMQSLALESNADFARYIKIIDGKTSALFEFACLIGASYTGDKKWTTSAKKAGLHLGRAYQMFDDICDWLMSEQHSGKTSGTDFTSEKYTLPIICLLSKLPKKQAQNLSKSFSNFTKEELAKLMKEHCVIDECAKIFDSEIASARKCLKSFDGKNESLLLFTEELESLMPHTWSLI